MIVVKALENIHIVKIIKTRYFLDKFESFPCSLCKTVVSY